MSCKIAVIGTGYVGLVASVGLADFGNRVVGIDIDEGLVATLNRGELTIFEPGLEEYLQKNLHNGHLRFSTDIAAAIHEADIVFLAVGTPSSENDAADLSAIYAVADRIADSLDHFIVLVIKSTVPIGTNRLIQRRIAKRLATRYAGPGAVPDFAVVSNPEFLREGSAVQDFFHPDRIVFGCEDDRAHRLLAEVYRGLNLIHVPFIWCDIETAELIKYVCNAFLATKIAFINQMATLAEKIGADIHLVARCMGMDGRISPKFLHPGPGFGGSCFPKDTKAMVSIAARYGIDLSLIREVIRSNELQKEHIVDRLEALAGPLSGKQVALLGLSFKANTDDVREAPSIVITQLLLERGAEVRAYDPQGLDNFRALFAERVSYLPTLIEALTGADALMLLTEWNEFRNLDLNVVKKAMRGDSIVDARNVLDAELARSLGFRYSGVGR